MQLEILLKWNSLIILVKKTKYPVTSDLQKELWIYLKNLIDTYELSGIRKTSYSQNILVGCFQKRLQKTFTVKYDNNKNRNLILI